LKKWKKKEERFRMRDVCGDLERFEGFGFICFDRNARV
jgi:hypothetical protein